MRRRRSALLLLVPLVLLAACGDDDDDDEAASSETTVAEDVPSNAGSLTTDDCAVTADEVGAAVGLPMRHDEVVDSGDGAWCTYAFDDGMTTASVDWYATTGAEAIEGAGAAWPDRAEVDVAGADDAVWSAENGGLVARRGEEGVRVFVNGPDIELDDPQGVAVVLAQVALGEMELEGE